MRKLFILVLAAMLLLGVGLFFPACSSSGHHGGDDDSSADDDATDDDAADDDAADDDSANPTWQEPPSSVFMVWNDAKTYCDNLNLDGLDDWRLPTISELRSLIRGCDATVTGGACTVTDDCLDSTCWNAACDGCDPLAGPGSGGAYWPDEMSGVISWYWSSSPLPNPADVAWLVNFGNGLVGSNSIGTGSVSVRCTRP